MCPAAVILFSDSSSSAELQKYGPPAGGPRFRFVSGPWPIKRSFAPVLGSTRFPLKRHVTDQMFQYPVAICAVVRGDSQLRSRAEHAGAMVEIGCGHETPLVMAFLGPGIGKQQEHASDSGVLDGVQENSSIVGEDANVVQGIPVDQGEQCGYSVDEGFATDHADVGVGRRLGCEVFAAAKSNFQPDLADLAVKTTGRIQYASGRERNSQSRQQTGQQ